MNHFVKQAAPTAVKRCSTCVMEAFGVFGVRPMRMIDIQLALTNAGYANGIHFANGEPLQGGYADVLKAIPSGDFVLITAGHAIAVRDGKITDAAAYGITNRVKVQWVIKVTKAAN